MTKKAGTKIWCIFEITVFSDPKQKYGDEAQKVYCIRGVSKKGAKQERARDVEG